MTFAIKGGGVTSAIRIFPFLIWKQKSFRIIPWLLKRVLHIIEVTINMVEYATSSQRSEQPKAKNVNFEPILNPLHVYKIKLQKKKEMGIKNG